jgi:hypothetical protein
VEGAGTGLVVSTCGSETVFDTQIGIYKESCHDLECIAFNDDSSSFGYRLGQCVSFFRDVGVMYYITVHGFGNELGFFRLSVDETNFQKCNQDPMTA